MSKSKAAPQPGCSPLDTAKQLAGAACTALSDLASIARSGAAMPVGDDRARIARRLVCWRREALPHLESLVTSLDTTLKAIHNDVIEARGGERFSLGWRRGETAFDVLLEVSRDVTSCVRGCPAAVEVGSRILCEQLETSIRLTGDDIEGLIAGINRDFALARQQGRLAAINATTQSPPTVAGQIPPSKSSPRLKRGSERGGGRVKIIAALTKHHRYAEDSCLNAEPIGNNELAKLAGVSGSTASAFIASEFEGHKAYRAMCQDINLLTAALKLLNNEFLPRHLYGSKLPTKYDRDE